MILVGISKEASASVAMCSLSLIRSCVCVRLSICMCAGSIDVYMCWNVGMCGHIMILTHLLTNRTLTAFRAGVSASATYLCMGVVVMCMCMNMCIYVVMLVRTTHPILFIILFLSVRLLSLARSALASSCLLVVMLLE